MGVLPALGPIKMTIELTDNEAQLLFMSSCGCEYCDLLYKKYRKEGFELANLTLREAIHIETTTRRKDIVNKVSELFKNHDRIR